MVSTPRDFAIYSGTRIIKAFAGVNAVFGWFILNYMLIRLRGRREKLVPGAGIEPARHQMPRDFKSLVSTNSTIRAAKKDVLATGWRCQV